MHSSFLLQPLNMPHVYETPDAARLSRREANRVTRFIEVATNAVDPAETERLIECFRISHALFARALLVKANEEFFLVRMVLLQPLPEVCLRAKELWFHSKGNPQINA